MLRSMQVSKTLDKTLDCLSEVEAAFGSQLLNMDFGQKELNAEVCLLLDAARKEQSGIEERLPSLWRELFKKLRKMDTSIPDSERKLATSLVFDCVLVILTCSSDVFYSYELSSCVRDADEQNNPDGCEERINMVLDALEPYEDELTGWIELYMEQTEKEKEDSSDSQSQSPFAKFVMISDKVDEILRCLHQLVGSQSTPKDQLAPIKAAIEYKPRLISDDVTVQDINDEFKLSISAGTFGNWIRGHHGTQYDDEYLTVYKELFDDQIMHKNVNSGL